MKDHFVPGIVLSGVLYGQNGRTRQGRAIFPSRVRTQANTWFASSCAPILYSLMMYKISKKSKQCNDLTKTWKSQYRRLSIPAKIPVLICLFTPMLIDHINLTGLNRGFLRSSIKPAFLEDWRTGVTRAGWLVTKREGTWEEEKTQNKNIKITELI